jgi:glycosyltransferase involved in cell wall biosynthesis
VRILLVHNFYAQPGGESGVFENLLRLLKRVGQDVDVYTRHNSEIVKFNGIQKLGAVLSGFFSLQTWREVKSLVRSNRPHVAIVQNVFPLISPSIYYALHSEGIPVIQLVYNYRFVCPDAQLFSLGEICERCVLGNHWHALVRKCYRNSRALSAWYASVLKFHRSARTFVRNIDAFLIPDQFLGTRLIAGGIPAAKLKKTVNPFFTDDYEPNYKNNNFILYVGRLVRQKGVFTLIRAMSRLPHSPPLYIVGDGESRKELQELINDLELQQQVKLLGTRWGSEVQRLIADSRFVVIPSEWYDNLPLILCQAFAMAKPVVASAINGIPEYIDNGVNGLLFEPGNDQQLAQCIDRLNNDNTLHCSMAISARRKAEEVFDYQAYWRILYPLIEDLASKRQAIRTTEAA